MQASMEWRPVTERSPGSGITLTSRGEENLDPLHFNGKGYTLRCKENRVPKTRDCIISCSSKSNVKTLAR